MVLYAKANGDKGAFSPFQLATWRRRDGKHACLYKQEETKPSAEYMYWYRSLPFIYASYRHFLTDPRSIPNSTNHPSESQQQRQQPQPKLFQQQHQPQLFQQQPQHQTFQQQPQPQPFQQQHQPFQQHRVNPNYSQQHTLNPYIDPQYSSYTQYTPSHSQTNYNYQTQFQQTYIRPPMQFTPIPHPNFDSPYIQQNPSTSYTEPPTTSYIPTVTHHDPPHTQSTPNLNLDLNVSDYVSNYEMLSQIWSPPPPLTQEIQDDPAPTEEEQQYGRGHPRVRRAPACGTDGHLFH
ncbi:altered inheritance of mitochondria protein 3-like [Vicia villosa]|uniref:altered inheritance of mitochondria protein 3-like n=1 Tax=Vicia villosa TaxID=3911 RepID=UPI00273C5431|nr:altered inheritance of mitochondria protein 3-like [Vicia villosa]